jgi:hypothetical protein
MSPKVHFPERKPMGTSAADSDMRVNSRVLSIEDSPHFSADRISIDDLYGDLTGVSPLLRHVLHGLATAKEIVRKALEALRNQQVIASDDAMQQLQALLPELFYCRRLGDGFGAIVNAIKCSFENAGGVPLSENQIVLIGDILARVHREPFLRFEAASELIGKLEDAGLLVDPPAIAVFSELLDVEGLR